MKNILLLATALSTLLLTSCFQHETTITLNKDGSGTIVEESRLGAQMIAMMARRAQMAQGFGGADAKDPMADMFSEEKAKKRATMLGEGVTFAKSEPFEVNGSKGAKVTFQFKDINQLKLKSGDSVKDMMPNPGLPQIEQAEKADEPITFAYQDGKLTVKMPKPKPAPVPAEKLEEQPGMDSPEAMEMMKQTFADMKMSVKLVIQPGIAETTATHKDGNTITLISMEFGKLMENPENLKKMASMSQKDPTDAIEAFKDIPGVQFETKPEITVTVN